VEQDSGVSFTPEQEAIAIEAVTSVWWRRDWRTEAKRAIADALSLDADAAAQIFHELLRRKLIEAHVKNEDAQKVGSGKASSGIRARYYRTKQIFHGVELSVLRRHTTVFCIELDRLRRLMGDQLDPPQEKFRSYYQAKALDLANALLERIAASSPQPESADCVPVGHVDLDLSAFMSDREITPTDLLAVRDTLRSLLGKLPADPTSRT
jgi:hypothetical protein